MIQKLRRKFIIILMSIVALTLLAVFVAMLLSSSGNSQRMSENMLRQALKMEPPPHGLRAPQERDWRNPIGGVSPNPRMPIMQGFHCGLWQIRSTVFPLKLLRQPI